MNLDKKKKEIEFEYKINVQETLLQNMFWTPMFLFVCIFASIGIAKVGLFVDQGFQLMYLVFVLFFTLRIFAWLGQPRIELKQEIIMPNKKRQRRMG